MESWEPDARVAVIASGGLTHFVIDEELDRRVLDSIAAKDAAGLAGDPARQAPLGELGDTQLGHRRGGARRAHAAVLDYVPGYRTPAGTGTGMAFARWE